MIVNSKLEIVLCNKCLCQLFDYEIKDELLPQLRDLSPLYQPDGTSSADSFAQHTSDAYSNGKKVFDWTHCDATGNTIPSSITLVKSDNIDEYGGILLIGYLEKKFPGLPYNNAEITRNKKAKAILDVVPLPHTTWTRDFKATACNKQSYLMHGLESEEQYLSDFFGLSPQFQPNGRKSSELAVELQQDAFATGYSKFKWLHTNLTGEEIPTEVTLVKVDEIDGIGGDFLVSFTKDLRDSMAGV